jgi:UDP:flavonoid glycosyltransferase YjiC (YdhE family)
MERVVTAASRAAVEVVLVRPDRRVGRRGLPPNVRTTGWLPFPPVFAAADAVIHHGGAGTLLTALAAGMPQLVVPGAGDRTVNAGLVAARGAGLAVAPTGSPPGTWSGWCPTPSSSVRHARSRRR